MEIERTRNITFTAFFRNSPPCMDYLSKNFDGNKARFKKALEILDKRCSKHKYFDMFYSPKDDSIKIVPNNNNMENLLPQLGRYISISNNERYSENIIAKDILTYSSHPKKTYIQKILNFFGLHKAKKYMVINPYEKLPSNVREAVDIIEKIEHSVVY